jgi:pyruvate/2-oxoglutarate dehydrogenase complex dihydrolipoamide acyltransferase (E2) component
VTRRLTKVNLPKSGMGIEEALIARWLKSRGDAVQEGEVIVEVETAKAMQELRAPATGRLVQVIVGQGETVPINTTLAVIESDNG